MQTAANKDFKVSAKIFKVETSVKIWVNSPAVNRRVPNPKLIAFAQQLIANSAREALDMEH